MKKNLAVLIFLLIGGVSFYYAYPIISERYFSRNSTMEKQEKIQSHSSPQISPQEQSLLTDDSLPLSDTDQQQSEENQSNNQSGQTAEKKLNIKANITPQHCSDECGAFASDLVLKNYCEEVCGLSPEKSIPDCKEKNGLEKDYCLKDLAISRIDTHLCEEIKDDNLRKTCSNRVTEEMLERSL